MKQLYYNGTIVTVNDSYPLAEALLVEDGKICAIGSLEDVQALQDEETTLVDLAGKTVLPGFIDGHGHIGNPAVSMPRLDPPPNGDIDSKEKLFKKIKEYISEGLVLESGWLICSGYDNAFFENNAHPTREELDELSTDIPMLVLHASNHVACINSKAMEVIGWTKDTKDPEGGVLQRDPMTGELNGVIEEKAVQMVGYNFALKDLSMEFMAKLFVDAQKFYAQQGVTTAQEGGTIASSMAMMNYCQKKNQFIIDIVSYPFQDYIPEKILDDSPEQGYENHLKIAGAKLVADGSPQAKTAWLTEPYYVKPENTEEGYKGYPIFSDDQMLAFCKEALEHNWQMLVHCNGDAAGDQFIHAYRQAQRETGNFNDLRPVMIHAQTVREDQLDAMKEIGMMPSYFHDHVFYWGDYHYESALGPERGSRISPLATTAKRSIPFTLHNDMPVTPINPLFNIHNAVNRVTRNGQKLGQEYCVDVMEAIKAVTIYGAYQYFDESIKGSLEVGKLADMVILDKNPLTVPKETIKDIKVLETIKEGKMIYKCECY